MSASDTPVAEGSYAYPIIVGNFVIPRVGRRFTTKLSKASDPKLVAAIREKAQDIVENGYKYFVKENTWYLMGGKRICVPKGFLTDGASGPGWDALDEECWLLHDFLYSTHNTSSERIGEEVTKEEADKVLQLPWRRTAVSLFGQDAWESSGKRGPQFLSL